MIKDPHAWHLFSDDAARLLFFYRIRDSLLRERQGVYNITPPLSYLDITHMTPTRIIITLNI